MADSMGFIKNSYRTPRNPCHKWIESEKAGCDIGFERALLIRSHQMWKGTPYCTKGHDKINITKAITADTITIKLNLRIRRS